MSNTQVEPPHTQLEWHLQRLHLIPPFENQQQSGIRVAWWTFDELYGRDSKFLDALDQPPREVRSLLNHSHKFLMQTKLALSNQT